LKKKKKKLQLHYILFIAHTAIMKFFTHKFWYHAVIWWVIWIIGLYWVFGFAITLMFDGLGTSLQPAAFPVSFIWWWNTYAGALIFKTPPENLAPPYQKITFSADSSVTVICKKQIHGYYFNAARGVGLLPLSSQTQTNDGVTVTWWLFTSCGTWNRLYDLVGILGYKKNGVSIGTWVFWVQTDSDNNSSSGVYLPGAISWKPINKSINNIRGRFFDTMFGIGEIELSSIGAWVVGSVSNLIGTFTNIYIQGHVGIGQSVESDEIELLTIDKRGTKTLLTSTDEILASTVINTVEKNKAKQCRNTIGNNKFKCISDNITHVIDIENIGDYVNKDVVFEQGDVFLDSSIYTRQRKNNFKPLSLYVANWNLIFDSSISGDMLTPVDSNGFYNTSSSITKWIYLVGNFITNGIVLWAKKETDEPLLLKYTSIPFKTFIHGKLTSLNTFTTVSEKRITLLRNLMSNRIPTLNTLSDNTYLWSFFSTNTWNAGMGGIFARRCADTPRTGAQAQTQDMGAYPVMPNGGFDTDTINAIQSIQCPADQSSSLIIIEKNIPTMFFNK